MLNREKIFKKLLNVHFLSFVIPVLVMAIVWLVNGIGPFGKRSMIIIDGLHQYLPFFSDYYNKLKEGSSLFYTWDVGGGNNFMSLWAYYLASPLNLIVLLFKKPDLYIGVSLILSLKICISGLNFSFFLTNRFKNNEKSYMVVAFSLAYAFSNYVVGYSWNLMWLDVVMMLPIVALGMDRLIKKRDARVYILALTYCMCTNYYISVIMCIFLVLWFLVQKYESFKHFILSGIRFSLASVLSAAMAAIVLLPAYYGISDTASANISMPKIGVMYGNFIDIIKTQMAGTAPLVTQTFDGGVNLYCGMLPVILILIALFSKNVKLGTKLKYGLLLVFFIVSFNNELLNYIWHGFHNQYGIPNRFSFLYIFAFLVIAYEVLPIVKGFKLWQIVLGIGLILGVVGYNISDNGTGSEVILPTVATVIVCAIYVMILVFYKLRYIDKKYFRYILAITMSLEMVIEGVVGFKSVGTTETMKYFNDTYIMEEASQFMEGMDAGLYRVDMINPSILDESTWNNFKSLGIFCTTVQGDMVTGMSRLGFYTGANEYLYKGATPLTNSMLGVKYMVAHSGATNNVDGSLITSIDGVDIYQNMYPLSMAYMVEDIDSWDYLSGNVFNTQNSFARDVMKSQNVFDVLSPVYSVVGNNCTATFEDGVIHYDRTSNKDVSIKVQFVVTEDMDLYTCYRGSNIHMMNITVNGTAKQDRYHIQAYHVGECTPGTLVTAEYLMLDDGPDAGILNIAAAGFRYDNFEKVYDKLQACQLEVTDYEDGYVAGYIDATKAGTMFSSIPYNAGWTVTIDGKKVETKKAMEAFLSFEVDKGQHYVEMKFVPEGFTMGVKLTAIGIGIYALLCIAITLRNRATRRRKYEEEN